MLNQATIILVFLLCSTAIQAQTPTSPLLERYDNEAIYLSPRFWQGLTFVKHTKRYPTGAYFKKLMPVMQQSPHALPFFQEARRLEITRNIVGAIPAGALLYFGLPSDQKDNFSDARFVRDMRNLGLAISFTTVVEGPLKFRSHQLLQKAVWMYNRDVMFGADQIDKQDDPLLERYNKETLYLRPTQLSGMKYVKNNQVLSARYFSGDLASEFDKTPSARMLYDQAVHNRRASRWAGTVGIISSAVGFALVLDAASEIDVNSSAPIASATFTKSITGLGLTVLGNVMLVAVQVPLSLKSERQLSEAIYLHNREVMFYR